MKTWFLHQARALLVAALLPLVTVAAAESPSLLLEKGIYAEEIERNLDSAIKIYEQIAAESAANRSVVAQAQYRLAVCYQKQGKKEQAIKLLNDLLQQFRTDADVGKKVRATLAELGSHPADPVTVRKVPLSITSDWLMSVSPDGRYVAYMPSNAYDVAVCEMATGKSQIIHHGTSWEEGTPWLDAVFSPDSSRLAYDLCGTAIWLSKVDGTDTRKIYECDATKEEVYAHQGWNADGSQVILSLYPKRPKPANSQQWYVALDVATGARKEIVRKPMAEGRDWWNFSRNGKFVAWRKGSYPRMLTLLDVKSGREETVVDRDAESVIGWSSDDSKLLYSKMGPSGIELWVTIVKEGKPLGNPQLVWSDLGDVRPLGITRDESIYYAKPGRGRGPNEMWVIEGFLANKAIDKESLSIGTDIPPEELVNGADKSVLDRKLDLSFKLPTGWTIRSAVRQGNGGNKIAFNINEATRATASIYYRSTTPWVEGPESSGPLAHLWGPKKPAPDEVDSWLRGFAEHTAQWVEQNTKDYKRDSEGFVSRAVGRHQALSWSGSFLRNDGKWTDLCLHVYSESAHALIVLRCPAESIDAIRPSFKGFVESLRLP